MHRWIVIAVVGCSSPHKAPPVQPPPPAQPDAAVAEAPIAPDAGITAPPVPACAVNTSELLSDGAPIVCGSAWSACASHELASADPDITDDRACCMRLDVRASKIEHVARPRRPTPHAVELRGKQICVGTTCKPAGRKLAAALGKLEADNPARATQDLKVVAFRADPPPGGAGGMTAWSVAGDAPLALAPPPRYRGTQGFVAEIFMFGDVFVADWTACAGPCDQARIYTSSNVPVGDPLDIMIGAVEATDKVFVILTDPDSVSLEGLHDRAQLFDLRTGKARGMVPVPAQSLMQFAKVDADSFAVMAWEDGGARIAIVSAANPDKPVITSEMKLPACAP